MKAGYTHIAIVLDRSGSMAAIKTETEGGFNSFIEAQKKVPGECSVTLAQFDDQYEIVYSLKPVAEVPLLELRPRGFTSLLDAIGKTIVDTGEVLNRLSEGAKPEKVIFLIVTDGAENSSKEYRDPAKIREMIAHQKKTYSWEFVFLAGNIDQLSAEAVGRSFGLGAGKTMAFAANSVGTRSAWASNTAMMSNYRVSKGSAAAAAASTYSVDDIATQTAAGASAAPSDTTGSP